MNKYREALEQVIKGMPEDWADLTCETVRNYIRYKMSILGYEVKVMHIPGFEDGCWVIPPEDIPGMYVTIRDINGIYSICILGGEK